MSKNSKNSSKSTNRALDKMIAKIEKAKKKGKERILVFTTDRNSYKRNLSIASGFGSSDLKNKLYEAYKTLLCEYNLKTEPANVMNHEIKWYVELKK
jgi:hypothetical protein